MHEEENRRYSENRRIVETGLHRRKVEQAAKEAQLENFEKKMIQACNANSSGAKAQREKEKAAQLKQKRRDEMEAARKAAQEAEQAKEASATKAVRLYMLSCMVLLLLCAWSHFPWWAAATMAICLMVNTGAYIYRIFVPWEV